MSDHLRDEQTPNGGTDPAATAENDAENAAKASDTVPPTGNTASKDGPKPVEMQLQEAQAKAAEYLEGLQRERADFVNYRKRTEQEKGELYSAASVDTLRKLLPVIDDFDRAISNVPADRAQDDVIKGFALIHRKLSGLLENAGITVINPIGQAFDPKYHEAIGQDENSEVASGHVSTVLQKGYVHNDKVLRPALVRVSA